MYIYKYINIILLSSLNITTPSSMAALALAAAPTPRSRVMQPLTVTNAVEPWRCSDFHGDFLGD